MSQDLWTELALAVALVFIIEGILPFLNPGRWRRLVGQLARTDDRTMRLTGLASMLFGLALLYLIKH
ncbi:DUF2065 domain-containing protein [uncultured Thalassolituus sp.]|uniref:DUF2065 domain-containing protein n=1 Tax=uncultured Thalassolituus sp. TaxID=285273 RepID=UPI002638D747|nr:DUF2065 domain-containing protein [uncultured Thalassolituus sp.]